MLHPELTRHQVSGQPSPWPLSRRIAALGWQIVWVLLCQWTPKPANPWRLFWLRLFGATIRGTPFVHQRARIQLPWNIELLDRACVGDRTQLYSLDRITLESHAVVAQEAYLCTGTHDLHDEHLPLMTGAITVRQRGFIGARAFIMPGVTIGERSIVGAMSVVTRDVPEQTTVTGNPAVQSATDFRIHRRQLNSFLETLLSPESSPGEKREATQEWFKWALEVIGINVNAAPTTQPRTFESESNTGTGKAINPREAAQCVWEFNRTAQFLRAMDAALQAAFKRFPGETIHLLEAGCGPLATLALPFTLRYPSDRLKISLIDTHQISLDSAAKLADALKVESSLHRQWCTDAAELKLPLDDRPHIIACEVLQRALTKEPQVAVTNNLAPQLRAGGFFLPQKIEVSLALFDPAKKFNQTRLTSSSETEIESDAPITRLGNVCTLDASAAPDTTDTDTTTFLSCNPVPNDIPPHHPGQNGLHYLTHLYIFEDQHLANFESSLNLPERLEYPDDIATCGGQVEFDYHIGRLPGPVPRFRVHPTSPEKANSQPVQ